MTAAPRQKIPESLLDAIRAALPIEGVIGRSVALKRRGAWHTGLCPFHGEKTPSFAVHPQRRRFNCFGCGVHGDVIGFVMRAEGLQFAEAVARCAGEAGLAADLKQATERAPWSAPRPIAAAPVARADDAADRTAWAARIWQEAEPIRAEGAVAAYLRGRCLWPLPAPCFSVLREARLRHPETGAALHPVMLARVDGPDGSLRAVHRTYLAPRPGGGVGKLAGVGQVKLVLGPLPGNAIRLFPAAPRLALAEGIETAIAVHALTGMPVWACVAAEILAAVELPFDVEEAVIFADRDAPKPPRHPLGHGVHAAHRLALRLRAQAVRTEVRVPREPHKDYADVLLARSAA